MRIGGFAGKVFQTLGAEPVAMPKDAIYSTRWNRASLDAFEWVGPYDDEKFGERKDGDELADLQGRAELLLSRLVEGRHAIASRRRQGQVRRSAESLSGGVARGGGDGQRLRCWPNTTPPIPAALKRLVVGGAQLRLFPQDALEACYKTANDLYAQLGADNPKFKKIADSYMAFRGDQYLWWQVAEYSFDNFMIRQRRSRVVASAAAPPRNARRGYARRLTPRRRCPRSRPATVWSAALRAP